MDSPIVDVNGVSFYRNSNPVLTDVTFRLNAKDYLAIIGPNGGGKSTLLRLLAGLYPPAKGTIKILGQKPQKARKKIGYLAQSTTLDSGYPIVVEDVVLMSRLQAGVLKRMNATDLSDCHAALTKVGLGSHLKTPFCNLSGGEKQRVLLARALMNTPELLILDEPTTGLDVPAKDALFELLSDLNQMLTIIIVSHDFSAISKEANKIACLNKKLHFHDSKELTKSDLTEAYGCEIDLISHGFPHRVLDSHD